MPSPQWLVMPLLAVAAQSAPPIVPTTLLGGRIKHVIVLMEENRSFDHVFGWATKLLGVNGLSGDEYNPVDTSDPKSERVPVVADAPYLNLCDPDHSTGATTSKIFGAEAVSRGDFSNASMVGFIEQERAHASSEYCNVLSGFTPERVPILTSLAQEFAVMDQFFASHPGPTWPNRLFCVSATSAGLTETNAWYQDKVGHLFPQKTIFDQVGEAGLEWRNYYNDTPWELFVESIAHQPDNLLSLENFYEAARTGTLPNYAWLNPRSGINITTGVGSNDQHPDHDVAAGEALYKDIYESLRSSPQWNETLFVLTYDEHGGFYDHVPPPHGVPPPDNETSYPDKGFVWDRLGVRLPTLLISPWIKKGTVISGPPSAQKPQDNSAYDLTSIMATARRILGMEATGTLPLTKRDAWAATFEHALALPEPRTDCPLHLPDAPPPATPAPSPPSHSALSPLAEFEAALPLNDLQRHIAQVHAQLVGVDFPHHITRQGQVSEWLQSQFQTHSAQTRAWKSASENKLNDGRQRSQLQASNYSLVVLPKQKSGFPDKVWSLNLNASVASHRGTLSSDTLKTPEGVPLCLDSNLQVRRPKMQVQVQSLTVSPCLPSPDIAFNRDQAQWWQVNGDGTVRPYLDLSLCVTVLASPGEDSPQAVGLMPCERGGQGSVRQSWAMHFKAPGDGGAKQLWYGDGAYALGVLEAS